MRRFDRAARDDAVKVIILAGGRAALLLGPRSAGGGAIGDQMAPFEPVGTWCGFGCAGAEGRMAREKEIYLGLSERWRNIPKPTIAQVQGKCIAGGLMLAWPCDLIVAADDAAFCDNTVGMGVNGVEYFAHPWELGPRKAKELLFTADWLSAQDAKALGMVNHVVPAADLSDVHPGPRWTDRRQAPVRPETGQGGGQRRRGRPGPRRRHADRLRPPPAGPQPQYAGPRRAGGPQRPSGTAQSEGLASDKLQL